MNIFNAVIEGLFLALSLFLNLKNNDRR